MPGKLNMNSNLYSFLHSFHSLRFVIILLLNFTLFSICPAQAPGSSMKWIATWSTAPQLVETNNNPPSPGLTENTLRQVCRVSLGGDSLRMRFSNEFSNSPVVLKEVHFAISKGNGVIDTTTDKVLYFNGSTGVTIAARSAITSDPFQFSVPPLTDVAITIYFGSTSADVTGHPGSRTTSYILTGNQAAKASFASAVKTDHWYVINTIDILKPDTSAVVAIIGNSITDGRGSGTNKQNRWPDILAQRLQANPDTRHIAMINEGIGGNCVLRSCLGPSALSRFSRDVLNQSGIKWVIVLHGINDIGQASGAQGSDKIAQDLITAYGRMIDSAHTHNLLIYGATLLPFGESNYSSVDHERARQTVNEWIRTSGRFDGVIDMEKALQDPNNPLKLLPGADTGDHLHPNETGHRMMGEAVDMDLFLGRVNTGLNEAGGVPDKYSLLQNYPNPFNPITNLGFRTTNSGMVTLKVYDILGNEVANLIDKEMDAGEHNVYFNAARLSSGVYFYNLKTGSYFATKKMMVLK